MATVEKQVFVVIDDHESVLGGTTAALQKAYPDIEILTADNSLRAQELIRSVSPQFVMTDLSIPESLGAPAQPQVGLSLLKSRELL